MSRSPAAALLAAATVALLTLIGTPTAASLSSTELDVPGDPLLIELTNVNPAVLPDQGRLRITGILRNVSDDTWREINLHPVLSAAPITDRVELAEAALSDPRQPVGDRITSIGNFASVELLAPGASVEFTLRVDRDALPVGNQAGPGVYWLGVHALGANQDGRATVAVGRARTFLPAVPADAADRVEASLVVPLRPPVRYTSDGAVADPEELTAQVDVARIEGLATHSPGRLSFLVDPALLDALARIGAGNPDRWPAVVEEDPQAEPAPEPEPDLAHLDALVAAFGDHDVLALPYGNLDLAAAVQYDARLVEAALLLGDATMQHYGVPSLPVLAPQALDRVLLTALSGAPVLTTDDQLDVEGPVPTRVRVAGREATVASSGAAAGGPGPGDATDMVGLRQRLLAEAALRLADETPQPLVVVLPETWSGSDRPRQFFAGLRHDWLDWVSLTRVNDDEATAIPTTSLVLDATSALRAEHVAAFVELTEAAEVLQSVLTEDDELAEVILAEAMTTLSYTAAPEVSLDMLRRAGDQVQQRLGLVTVDAPSYGTLTSETGRIPVTVANGLDQTVTVRLEARAEAPLEVSTGDSIVIGPGAQSTVLVSVRSPIIGVHNVEFVLTDENGRELGDSARLPVQAGQVSQVIWVVIAAGAIFFVVAVVLRIRRRRRRVP
ncbi:DUF6049 family protein [Nocardioides limicola]|uniref:DUF6049 family protein n=1 Tax=Nocardioides limicola TaxID=2803368 RepID=UPI00193C4971|nr:DUF6049 family protein [Nocardioides sp. DJM-14]